MTPMIVLEIHSMDGLHFHSNALKKEKEMFRDKSMHMGGQKKLQLYRNTVCYKMI